MIDFFTSSSLGIDTFWCGFLSFVCFVFTLCTLFRVKLIEGKSKQALTKATIFLREELEEEDKKREKEKKEKQKKKKQKKKEEK